MLELYENLPYQPGEGDLNSWETFDCDESLFAEHSLVKKRFACIAGEYVSIATNATPSVRPETLDERRRKRKGRAEISK